LAIAAYDQTRRSYVDPNYKFPLAEDADFAAHVRAYRTFVRYSIVFAAHAAVILALMAYFFAGTP
jgi:hypothetical protein